LADADTVRLLIGDREKQAVNEDFGQGDGSNNHFQLSMYPLITENTGTLTILLTGTTAVTNTYTISGAVGHITFSTGNEPANGATLLGSYRYVALTTAEIADILSGHTGSPYLAAANAAMVLAADASRLFSYAMGDKSVDKRRVANNLIELSKELENKHYGLKEIGSYTADVITFKDDTGTYYDEYDTAVAYLTGTS